jgi:hypothetical protein
VQDAASRSPKATYRRGAPLHRRIPSPSLNPRQTNRRSAKSELLQRPLRSVKAAPASTAGFLRKGSFRG